MKDTVSWISYCRLWRTHPNNHNHENHCDCTPQRHHDRQFPVLQYSQCLRLQKLSHRCFSMCHIELKSLCGKICLSLTISCIQIIDPSIWKFFRDFESHIIDRDILPTPASTAEIWGTAMRTMTKIRSNLNFMILIF